VCEFAACQWLGSRGVGDELGRDVFLQGRQSGWAGRRSAKLRSRERSERSVLQVWQMVRCYWYWSASEIQAVVFSTSSDKYNCLNPAAVAKESSKTDELGCKTFPPLFLVPLPTAAIVLPHVPPSDRYELGTALVHQ